MNKNKLKKYEHTPDFVEYRNSLLMLFFNEILMYDINLQGDENKPMIVINGMLIDGYVHNFDFIYFYEKDGKKLKKSFKLKNNYSNKEKYKYRKFFIENLNVKKNTYLLKHPDLELYVCDWYYENDEFTPLFSTAYPYIYKDKEKASKIAKQHNLVLV